MKHLHQPQRGFKAFTLIELLVVIAIIAILAAILFPVFVRARENARRSSCQSNMKQIGLGLIQYTQDYDETQVAWSNGPNAYNSGSQTIAWTWNDSIYPYVKSEQIFNCPSAQFYTDGFAAKRYQYVQPGTPGRTYTTKTLGSYAINAAVQYKGGGYYYGPVVSNPADAGLWDAGTVKLSSLQTPATTVFVVETLGWRENSGTDTWANAIKFINGAPGSGFNPVIMAAGAQTLNNPKPSYRTMGEGTGEKSELAERHLDTTNVLYCDGHVKAIKLDALNETKVIGGVQVNVNWTAQDD